MRIVSNIICNKIMTLLSPLHQPIHASVHPNINTRPALQGKFVNADATARKIVRILGKFNIMNITNK